MVGHGDAQPPAGAPTQGHAYSTGMSSAIRSPAGSGAPSPTDGAGLSRRLSWNASQGEAISMHDLSRSVLVSGAAASASAASAGGPSQPPSLPPGASIGPPPGRNLHNLHNLHSQPLDSTEYDLGAHPPPLSSPATIVSEHGSFHTPVPLFDSVGTTHTAYASSLHSDEDLVRLTPNGPGVDRRSPSGRRVYDSEGRARSSPLGRIARSPTVRRVSNTLRFAGERVVGIMGDKNDKGAYENLIRTTTDEESMSDQTHLPLHESPTPPLRIQTTSLSVGLRGRTLGIFTARNPLRRAMDKVLRFSCVTFLLDSC